MIYYGSVIRVAKKGQVYHGDYSNVKNFAHSLLTSEFAKDFAVYYDLGYFQTTGLFPTKLWHALDRLGLTLNRTEEFGRIPLPMTTYNLLADTTFHDMVNSDSPNFRKVTLMPCLCLR